MGLFKTIKFITNHPLNKKNKTRTIIKYLKWQINTLFNPYRIIYPFTERSLLIIEKGMTGATGNLYCGLHEFNEMSFLLHFLRPNDLFVDVGANIGSYTILASAHIGARSIAFEPVKSTYDKLILNILVNQISDKVIAYNKAVGNINGIINITNDYDTTNHIIINNENKENIVKVSICKLDDIIKEKNPVLIKIDVEGYETEVLEGAKNILKNDTLKAIIIELNGSGKRYGYDEKNIHDKLVNLGFEPYNYLPFTRKLLKANAFGNNNTLYVRNIDFVNQRMTDGEKIKINNISY